MIKRSNQSGAARRGAQGEEVGRLPRRVAHHSGPSGRSVPAQRRARRLLWRQGRLRAFMAVPETKVDQVDALASVVDSGLATHEPELTLETLLDMVEHVMLELPREGLAVPGHVGELPETLRDQLHARAAAPLPDRLRRVESILKSLAQMLLATV